MGLDCGVQIGELCSERTGQRPSNLGQECFSEEIFFLYQQKKEIQTWKAELESVRFLREKQGTDVLFIGAGREGGRKRV